MGQQPLRLLDDPQAGEARQVAIGQHHVEPFLLQPLLGLDPVGHRDDPVGSAQELGHQLAAVALDLDQQHPARTLL